MRRYDERVRPALRALGLTDDDTDLLPFVARNGWTALPTSWHPPDSTAPWPAVRITGHDGARLGFGVDSAYLGNALAAAVVDAVERVGETRRRRSSGRAGRYGRRRQDGARRSPPAPVYVYFLATEGLCSCACAFLGQCVRRLRRRAP